ncbi:MAG: DUF441 domain-containing protein [Firmicutes bacterium]|jgi:uncharacterized membrane protein (DUF441 family)|nr:DUF441 domain-containing protein [Bacillota bacterium]
MNTALPILIILIAGLISGNSLITGASAILLFVKSAGFTSVIVFFEERALQLGLVFLTIAILTPFTKGQITVGQIFDTFFSLPGILAMVGGAAATCISGQGISLLTRQPQITSGIILGTIIGVVLFRGIPVGPLAAAGITALLLKIFRSG